MPKTKWIVEGRQRGKSWIERMYAEGPMPNEIDLKGLRKGIELERAIGWINIDVDVATALLDEIEQLRNTRIQDGWRAKAEKETTLRVNAEAEVSALKFGLERLREYKQLRESDLLRQGDIAAERDVLKTRLAECEGHYAWAVEDGKKLRAKLERVREWAGRHHSWETQQAVGGLLAILEEQS